MHFSHSQHACIGVIKKTNKSAKTAKIVLQLAACSITSKYLLRRKPIAKVHHDQSFVTKSMQQKNSNGSRVSMHYAFSCSRLICNTACRMKLSDTGRRGYNGRKNGSSEDGGKGILLDHICINGPIIEGEKVSLKPTPRALALKHTLLLS